MFVIRFSFFFCNKHSFKPPPYIQRIHVVVPLLFGLRPFAALNHSRRSVTSVHHTAVSTVKDVHSNVQRRLAWVAGTKGTVFVFISCITSVSNRVIVRTLEREQKKGGLPGHSFVFALIPNFLDELVWRFVCLQEQCSPTKVTIK